MGAFDFLSGYDGGGANRATASVNEQYGDALGTYTAGNNANQVLNTQLGNTNYYGTAQQVYGQQQGAANSLLQAANGNVASAAQLQMQQGLGQANQQAQSAALSQQGGVLSGNTQRNMLNAQAANSQNVLGQSAILRAQEQATARDQYASLLNSMQTQQQAQGQAQYNQGQNMLNTGIGLQGQQYQNDINNYQQVYNNRMGNYSAQAAANVAGMNAGANLLKSGASAVTSAFPKTPGTGS